MIPGCTGPDREPALLIARTAGLDAGAVTALGSRELGGLLNTLHDLDDRLGHLRATLVERLFEAVPHASPKDRKLLLQVKRDLFNGRAVTPRTTSPRWAKVEAACGDRTEALAEVLRLEARRRELEDDLAALLEAQGRRETEHLTSWLDPGTGGGLLRGIALGSPALLASAARLAGDGDLAARKQRAARGTLLRYVTRAALKLSPCSTLTRVGLAETTGDDGPPRFLPGPWREDSLLRLRRTVLGRVWAALLRHPPFTRGLPVTLNDTLEETGPDHYRFLRPGHWVAEGDGGRIVYRRESLVEVRLAGALVGWLRRELPGRPVTRGELVARVAGELGRGAEDETTVHGLLEPLWDAGFLVTAPPWATQEARFEHRLLELLEGVEGTGAVRAPLARVVALEDGYAGAGDPARAVRDLEAAAEATWRAAADLAGLDGAAGLDEFRRGTLYEDVFVSTDAGAVLTLSRRRMDELARTLAPLHRLAEVFSPRHDWGLALAAFAARTWPGRERVPVLELFSAASGLWKGWVRHCLEEGPETRVFDPFGLPETRDLERLRRRIRRGLDALVHRSPEGEAVLDALALATLAAEVPARFRSPLGGCYALQPADRQARRWVLNKTFTGSGRMGSRFTPTMPEALRGRYLQHLKARGQRPAPTGETLELLDVLCIQGDTLNVHEVQTPRVLELPGGPSGLPAPRRRRLGELSVVFEAGRAPVLADDDRLFLPVYLGLASHHYLPAVARFVTALGPGETSPVWPAPPPEPAPVPGVAVEPPLVLADVVLRRRTWRVAPPPPAALRPDGWVALHRWRTAAGLPDRVFWAEPRAHQLAAGYRKPQYLDWTSPAAIELFRSAYEPDDAPLVFTEALPDAGDFPTGGSGRPRAVEVLVDELALAPVHRPADGRASDSRASRGAGPDSRPRGTGVPSTAKPATASSSL